jgi:hypothetical protein
MPKLLLLHVLLLLTHLSIHRRWERLREGKTVPGAECAEGDDPSQGERLAGLLQGRGFSKQQG